MHSHRLCTNRALAQVEAVGAAAQQDRMEVDSAVQRAVAEEQLATVTAALDMVAADTEAVAMEAVAGDQVADLGVVVATVLAGTVVTVAVDTVEPDKERMVPEAICPAVQVRV